jgi:hypothetical protein
LAAQESHEQQRQRPTLSNGYETEYDEEGTQQTKHAGHQKHLSTSTLQENETSLSKGIKKQQADIRNNGNTKRCFLEQN